MNRKVDIHDRLLRFGIRVIKLSKILCKNPENRIIANQLIRAGTSVGANMQEADAGSSKKDFINKVNISKKEIQETNYWLKIIKGADLINHDKNKKDLEDLLDESDQLKRIIEAILFRAKEKQLI